MDRSALGFWTCIGLSALAVFAMATRSGKVDKDEPRPPAAHDGPDTEQAGSPYQISNQLVDAVIFIESRGEPEAVGTAGERGLMQIMPNTWKEMCEHSFGRDIPFDRAFEPELNMRVGTAYLSYLAERFRKQEDAWQASFTELVLAGYNAGPSAVEKAEFEIANLPESVQTYVQRGSDRLKVLKKAKETSLRM